MRKALPPIGLVVVCLMGGCTIQRICPAVQGTVVDAVTGAPIEDASLRIEYFDAHRTTRTDRQGRFSFAAKYKVFPLINVHLGRISGFRLQAEAKGHQSRGIEVWTHVSTESPPHELMLHGPKHSHRMLYTGKAIVMDPIRLARTPPAEP